MALTYAGTTSGRSDGRPAAIAVISGMVVAGYSMIGVVVLNQLRGHLRIAAVALAAAGIALLKLAA